MRRTDQTAISTAACRFSSSRELPFCIFAAALILLTGSTAPVPAAAPDEFRGMWVTRFEWPDPDPAKAMHTIDTIMSDLAAAHFNAVLFQVRGQADTFYPSPEEPWSPMIAPDGQDPGWDPLAYALQAAHANGLAFHAYINTHVAWQASGQQPPADPNHLYYRHCNAADPDARDWLIHNQAGEPVGFESDNYVWLAPGVPASQAYIRRQVMYVVNHYDVDGVHFDRIRTPGPHYSHDPISSARQAPGSEGNPHHLDFADWTRDQFTRFLRDMTAEILEVKPHVVVSVAPAGLYRQERYPGYPDNFFYGFSKVYQDAQAWLAAGVVDLVIPQIYWADDGRLPGFADILADWVAHTAGRHIAAGQNRRWSLDQLADQVRAAATQGAAGVAMFHYSGFKQKGGFAHFAGSGGVYEQPARPPAMTWKTHPVAGTILGHITAGESGEPVIDAHVIRDGHDDVALSSGDGLFSFLDVPPGTHALTFSKQGRQPVTLASVTVAAGQATRVDVALDAATEQDDATHIEQASIADGQPDAPPLAQPPTWRPMDRDPDRPERPRILLGIGIVLVILAVGAAIARIVATRKELAERRKRDAERDGKPPQPPLT